MTPAERRRRFLAAIRAQAKRRGIAIEQGVLEVLGTLAEMQEAIRQTLAAEPSDFDAFRLPRLMAEVDRQVDLWQRRAISMVGELLEGAWERGPQIVNAPLAAAQIRLGETLLPDSLLRELVDYSASKISEIGPVAKRRIEQHVRLGLLGGQSPHEVMKGIGGVVDPKPLRFVSFRAETITRTEMGRVHDLAAYRRIQDAAEKVSGLGKSWLWSGKSRAMHRAINGQVRAVDQPFDMPDGVQMQHPHDPEAPVEHVANCACVVVPHKADW